MYTPFLMIVTAGIAFALQSAVGAVAHYSSSATNLLRDNSYQYFTEFL